MLEGPALPDILVFTTQFPFVLECAWSHHDTKEWWWWWKELGRGIILLGIFFLQSGLPDKVCLGPQDILEVDCKKALVIASFSGWGIQMKEEICGNEWRWNGEGFPQITRELCGNVCEEWLWMRGKRQAFKGNACLCIMYLG